MPLSRYHDMSPAWFHNTHEPSNTDERTIPPTNTAGAGAGCVAFGEFVGTRRQATYCGTATIGQPLQPASCTHEIARHMASKPWGFAAQMQVGGIVEAPELAAVQRRAWGEKCLATDTGPNTASCSRPATVSLSRSLRARATDRAVPLSKGGYGDPQRPVFVLARLTRSR